MGDKGEEGVITHKSKKIGDVIYGWPIPIIFYKCTSGMHFQKSNSKIYLYEVTLKWKWELLLTLQRKF